MSRPEFEHLHSPKSSEQNLLSNFLVVVRKTNLQVVNEGDIPWGFDSFTERNRAVFLLESNGVKKCCHQKLWEFLPVDLNWMASRITRRPSFKLTLDLTLRKYKSGQLTIFFTRIGTKAKQLLEDFFGGKKATWLWSLSVSKSYIWIGRRKSQANIPVRVIRILFPMPYKIELWRKNIFL